MTCFLLINLIFNSLSLVHWLYCYWSLGMQIIFKIIRFLPTSPPHLPEPNSLPVILLCPWNYRRRENAFLPIQSFAAKGGISHMEAFELVCVHVEWEKVGGRKHKLLVVKLTGRTGIYWTEKGIPYHLCVQLLSCFCFKWKRKCVWENSNNYKLKCGKFRFYSQSLHFILLCLYLT